MYMEEMMKEQIYTTFDISHHVGETLILQQNLSGIEPMARTRKVCYLQEIHHADVYILK
jgi:hypothetical protein